MQRGFALFARWGPANQQLLCITAVLKFFSLPRPFVLEVFLYPTLSHDVNIRSLKKLLVYIYPRQRGRYNQSDLLPTARAPEVPFMYRAMKRKSTVKPLLFGARTQRFSGVGVLLKKYSPSSAAQISQLVDNNQHDCVEFTVLTPVPAPH